MEVCHRTKLAATRQRSQIESHSSDRCFAAVSSEAFQAVALPKSVSGPMVGMAPRHEKWDRIRSTTGGFLVPRVLNPHGRGCESARAAFRHAPLRRR